MVAVGIPVVIITVLIVIGMTISLFIQSLRD